MPPNPERRAQLLDAAIDILADVGVGGLTHRQVDDRAGLPAGTTSNYFRTRQALLEATAARTVDLHWRRVEALRTVIGPLTRDGVKVLLTRMISEPDEQARRYTLARFELFMEGTRRPELRPFLARASGRRGEVRHADLRGGGFRSDAPADGGAEPPAQWLRLQQPHHCGRPRTTPPEWWSDCCARSSMPSGKRG